MDLVKIRLDMIRPDAKNPREDWGDLDRLAAAFEFNGQAPHEPVNPIICVEAWLLAEAFSIGDPRTHPGTVGELLDSWNSMMIEQVPRKASEAMLVAGFMAGWQDLKVTGRNRETFLAGVILDGEAPPFYIKDEFVSCAEFVSRALDAGFAPDGELEVAAGNLVSALMGEDESDGRP